jgi:hypothetical protein
MAKERIMPLTQEQRNMVVDELQRFATDLSLSEDQKQKLQGFLSEASEKLQEYKQQNPNALREDLIRKVADNRATIRQRLVGFLTPEQLTKWDAEAAKAKEFLGRSSRPKGPARKLKSEDIYTTCGANRRPPFVASANVPLASRMTVATLVLSLRAWLDGSRRICRER